MDSAESSPKVPLLHADPRQEGIGQAWWALRVLIEWANGLGTVKSVKSVKFEWFWTCWF